MYLKASADVKISTFFREIWGDMRLWITKWTLMQNPYSTQIAQKYKLQIGNGLIWNEVCQTCTKCCKYFPIVHVVSHDVDHFIDLIN